MSSVPLLHLASSSPRRQQILRGLGLLFTAKGPDIDESGRDGETPEQMVLRLAAAKARAANVVAGRLVLGADTAVVLRGRVLSKPRDESDAIDMLMSLSGCSHTVLTGVALQTPHGSETVISATDVRFREIDRDEASAYWQSGEPRDKAGAYAIQGLGGMFVEAISGSYSGVVGLPVFETVKLLQAAGVDVLVKNND